MSDKDSPSAAQQGPYVMEMQPGRYWWCACGRSAKQPFCDGTHKDGPIRPIKVELAEKRTVAWCGCKRSGNKPYCDGSHGKDV